MSRFRIRPLRRTVQAATVLAFLLIPWLNTREIYFFTGNMAAFRAGGLPLADPLAALQVAAAAFTSTPDMILGAGLVLLFAVLLGPVFCSWLCPFGFLSELVKGNRQGAGSTPEQKTIVKPFLIKTCLIAAGLLLIVSLTPVPLLTQLSMPAWFTRFWQHAISYRHLLWPALFIIPGLLLIEYSAKKRVWCRYFCPQSVLISLAGLALPRRLRVGFNKRACTCPASDRACRKACSLDLNPRESTLAQKLQCTNCGDCIDACAGRGCALGFEPALWKR